MIILSKPYNFTFNLFYKNITIDSITSQSGKLGNFLMYTRSKGTNIIVNKVN